MPFLLRRHAFLLLGILTACLFFLVAALDRAGNVAIVHALDAVMRVLIVPMYLMWLLMTMLYVALAGPRGLSGPLGMIVSLFNMAAGLAPYMLADYLIHRGRAARQANHN